MASYSIIHRKTSAGPVFMARFYTEGKGTARKVLRSVTFPQAKTRKAAILLAEAELSKGMISNAANPDALAFILAFWKPDSEYVKKRRLRGKIMSVRYLEESRLVINKHMEKYLTGKKLLDIDINALEDIQLKLADKGVGARRINAAMQAVCVPIGFFCRKHKLANPVHALEKVAEKPRARGSLSVDEVKKIIKLKGQSPRAKAAVLLGCLSGLRLGEIRALRWENIDEAQGTIHVKENYVDRREGSKAPKSGEGRDTLLPKPVLDALCLCGEIKPDSRYILWNDKTPSLPVCSATIQSGFRRILDAIGIDEAKRLKRNLVFHSCRHTAVSMMRAEGIPDYIIQNLVGHAEDGKMTENYSHITVVDFQSAKKTMEKTISIKRAAKG